MQTLSANMQSTIVKLFELENIRTGLHHNKFSVDHYWLIVVPGVLKRTIAIAGIQKVNIQDEADEWLEGALLVPTLQSIQSHGVESIFIEDIKPIKLSEPDPIEEVLQSMTVLPVGRLFELDGVTPYFHLYTATRKASVQYFYSGVSESDSIKKLWSAIWNSMRMLLKEHNHQEMMYIWEHFKGYPN